MLTWKEVTRRPSVREGSPMHTGDSRLGRKSAPSDMQGITCRPSVMEGSSMHTGYSRHGNKSRPSGRKSHARKHHITPIARLSCSHGRKSHVAPLSWKEVPCTLATPDMEGSLIHLTCKEVQCELAQSASLTPTLPCLKRPHVMANLRSQHCGTPLATLHHSSPHNLAPSAHIYWHPLFSL